LYYSQILWVDDLKIDDDGSVWYRINERYGSPGDIFWARAEAFRPLTDEEMSPISPDVDDKRVVVDVNYGVQSLSCYEGNSEVYFCRISSGKLEGSTPISPIGTTIWRKLYSIHMAGGTNADGWDLPGIGWTSLFVGDGVAIHSTFWHNNFGEPMSHGCVNARPEDAKWIFRWVQPTVPFETGDITIVGQGGTRVIVNQW
jgi:lipoprotein-anchoring transpeptidase ErfK/SrfK